MSSTLLLVHSPLVGPSSWSDFASLARLAGADVVVPDLTGVAIARSPRWCYFVDEACSAVQHLEGPVTVVGHSGAGVGLPVISAKLGDRCSSVIFMDAVVPPTSGAHRTSTNLIQLLDQQNVDGVLRRWLEWWPDEVVRGLVPDLEQRSLLLDDMPRLPRAFYDEEVVMPDQWTSRAIGYLQLSPAYDADRKEAMDCNWPTISLNANHLSTLTAPDEVLTALQELVEASRRRNGERRLPAH